MYVWSKLSAAKWIDAWEDRFHGNPNFVLDFLKGGKSVRVQVFCESKKDADAIVKQFGGSVRKLGSGPVYACDFDPFAVTVAERNAVRNHTDGIEVKEQDILKWKPRKKGYDVVLANIFSTVLIQAWPVIAKSVAPGGDLIVSGILASQAWDVFEAAAKSGLGFTKVIKKGKWVTAHGGHMDDLIKAG